MVHSIYRNGPVVERNRGRAKFFLVKLLSGNELSEDYTHPNIQIYAIYSLFSMKTTFFFRDNAMFSIF